MLRTMNHAMTWIACGFAVLVFSAPTVSADAPKPVRLFILSGQSNMVGMDADAHFTPKVQAAFPDDEVVVVKHAVNGNLIRMWYKQWEPPAGEKAKGQGKNGRHYDTLMARVAEAMQGKPTPTSVTFVWMQGEADANHAGYGEMYLDALNGLLRQLQDDLGRRDVDMVVGRISDYGNEDEARPGWNLVRAAQVKFAEEDPERRAWVDTDDLNGDKNGLHYGKEGYAALGERFADKSIELIRAD